MKWVKRGFWVAAWGCWVWLSVLLFDWLPQRPGPTVRQLYVGPWTDIVGFLDDEHKVVFEYVSSEGGWLHYAVDLDADKRVDLSADTIRRLTPINKRAWINRLPAPRKRYFTFEHVRLPFDWQLPRGWTPVTIVDFDTHQVTGRTWDQPYYWESWDETLAVTADGTVFQLPFRTDWPLFLVVQTILAVPLVLLWTVLRWRRKQRARLASVAP
jgi:hypothetical protein